MPKPAATPGLRAAAARHNISNIVIKVDGDKAASLSHWFHYSNDSPQRRGVFDGFGHYEDGLVKVNGKWLFTKRKIYNEGRDEWAYTGKWTHFDPPRDRAELPAELPSRNPNIAHRFDQTGSALPNQR